MVAVAIKCKRPCESQQMPEAQLLRTIFGPILKTTAATVDRLAGYARDR